MTSQSFVHLRLHSAYSLLEGAIPVKKLAGLCHENGMAAVAVTDTNNMFAALEISEALSKAGIQPIIGCQIDFSFGVDLKGQTNIAPLVLLAQTEAGFKNLMALNTVLYMERSMPAPHILFEDLERHSAGLICLTGGAEGPLGKLILGDKAPEAKALLDQLKTCFQDRLYIEFGRHGTNGQLRTEDESLTERYFLDWAYGEHIPLVATNNVFFPNQDMFEAHDALICIAEGAYVDQSEPRRHLTLEHYFKSVAEMHDRFKDIPEAIENTVEISKRCAFKAECRAPILPRFAENEAEELKLQAKEGLKARLASIPHYGTLEEYETRLDFELSIIEEMGFPGYFLIVADFIKWAKEQKIPVGPGRGSGAGSLVAFALTITDLDPLRYNLLFERFLNPERVSMPDFDIDFCMDRRDEVIEYVQKRYGKDKVAQIITFGQLLSKAAIRDVGRVLQMPYGQVDRLSKLIPVEGVKPVSISQALKDEPRLKEEARREEVVARLLDIAKRLEGLNRNASTHAAGVVIADRPLDELVPIYRDPRTTMPATQFNMKWVEQAGLVKFDFLGLKTLTVIQYAIDMLKERGVDIDINAIPLDDEATYKLYAEANTVAVFQVESSGMRDALRMMKPTTIEDIVALVALYRPGPMENIPKYCRVKNGLEERESIHPLIDHILEETQGIIVYQEQVMQIAQEMAGYTLGGADLLRRAMGKKIKEAMDAERPKFIKGAKENGVDEKKAQEVFDLLEKFANYGFNKSHAAAYAVVSYQTAWLKANYPVEFMAAVMNADLHLTDKLHVYKTEIDRLEIDCVPPSINQSEAKFSVKDGKLLYALGALKNVGVEAMHLITTPRNEFGLFKDLFDFARRVDLKRVGKRPLEMLVRAGAFDCFDKNRQRVFSALDILINYSASCHEEQASSQNSLFGDVADLPTPKLPTQKDWLPSERLQEERNAIGFYLSGHPLDVYAGPLERKNSPTLPQIMQLAQSGKTVAQIAGSVTKRQERKSAKGNRFAFVEFSRPEASFEATVFSDVLEANRSLLEPGSNIVATVEAELVSDQLKLLLRAVQPIDRYIADAASCGMRIFIEEPHAIDDVGTVLEDASKQMRDAPRGPVHLVFRHKDLNGEVELSLRQIYAINEQIKAAIKSTEGVSRVEDF